MTHRITNRDLAVLINRLNDITGSPLHPWIKGLDGHNVAQLGNYHLTGAYGGLTLHRMHNAGGGVTTPLGGGIMTKRGMYDALHAYINGFYEGKELAKSRA